MENIIELSSIEESGNTYNNRIIIPEAFLPPKWYEDQKNQFKKEVTELYQKNKKIESVKVRKLIEDIIIESNKYDIKIKYPLNSKNIKSLIQEMHKKYSNDIFLWKYAMLYEMSFFLSTFKPSSFDGAKITKRI